MLCMKALFKCTTIQQATSLLTVETILSIIKTTKQWYRRGGPGA